MVTAIGGFSSSRLLHSLFSLIVKLQAKAYDFLINPEKFEKEFNFKFEETVESITKSLVDNYDSMDMGNRSDARIYRNK